MEFCEVVCKRRPCRERSERYFYYFLFRLKNSSNMQTVF